MTINSCKIYKIYLLRYLTQSPFFIRKKYKKLHFRLWNKKSKNKRKIIQVNVNLKLVPAVKNIDKNIDVSVELASVVQLSQDLEKRTWKNNIY